MPRGTTNPDRGMPNRQLDASPPDPAPRVVAFVCLFLSAAGGAWLWAIGAS